MNWDALFADLEAEAEGLQVQARAAEVEERTRGEMATIALDDRLVAAVGTSIRCVVTGGMTFRGQLLRRGDGWLLLDEGTGREVLVLTKALSVVADLGRNTTPAAASGLDRRLSPNHILRGLARDRSAVSVVLIDGHTIQGTIDRVGADFIDVAVHPCGELRRREDVRGIDAVLLASIAGVRHLDI